jgi:protein involved in polysaccharide export with SLBB domain
MKCRLSIAFVFFLLSALAGCSGAPHDVNLPPPVKSTTLGVGDEFEFRIAGEDKLPTTYIVASDGTVNFPFVHQIQVEGLEPQQIEKRVHDELVSKEIYADPTVSILVKAYNSKRIEIIGEIHHPGSLPLEPGMTLVRAITLSGGFTPTSDKGAVTIRRKINGRVRIVSVNVNQILDNKIDDVPLQAGDTINIDQTIL